MINTPTTFTRGVTLEWSESFSDYPASVWNLSYAFVNSQEKIEVNATASGDDFSIKVTPSNSESFKPGRYDWQAYVDDGTDRYCVGSGSTIVIEDFASTTGFDGRSLLRQIIDSINAHLRDTATDEQQKVRYKEREIWQYSRTELLQIRRELMRELAAEERINNPHMHSSVIRAKIR